MDCLDTLEVAYVELTGLTLFRENTIRKGGILMIQVYAIQVKEGIIVINPVGKRVKNKKIGIKWIREIVKPIFESPESYQIERIKYLYKNVNIKKVYWKHKINEEALKLILKAVKESQKIYDN